MSNPAVDDQSERDFFQDRWPAATALIACILLYLVLPTDLIIQPRWLIPVLELLPLLVLVVATRRLGGQPAWARSIMIALVALINLANVVSVVLLIHHLLHPTPTTNDGRTLVFSAALVWVTNVIVFGLWFWELDRGGPALRGTAKERWADFQFPQMANPETARPGWRPRFIDYLYVGFTNASAFSPTDAMPLTPMAKVLMSAESLVSMVTVLVVAARAVNILT